MSRCSSCTATSKRGANKRQWGRVKWKPTPQRPKRQGRAVLTRMRGLNHRSNATGSGSAITAVGSTSSAWSLSTLLPPKQTSTGRPLHRRPWPEIYWPATRKEGEYGFLGDMSEMGNVEARTRITGFTLAVGRRVKAVVLEQ
jgi:hypothetical protein